MRLFVLGGLQAISDVLFYLRQNSLIFLSIARGLFGED